MKKHDRRVVHVYSDRQCTEVLCGLEGENVLGVDASDVEDSTCQECRSHVPRRYTRRLSRNERLQGLVDSGCDTWAEYRGER